jgi:hypothetical protein
MLRPTNVAEDHARPDGCHLSSLQLGRLSRRDVKARIELVISFCVKPGATLTPDAPELLQANSFFSPS